MLILHCGAKNLQCVPYSVVQSEPEQCATLNKNGTIATVGKTINITDVYAVVRGNTCRSWIPISALGQTKTMVKKD